MLASQPAKDLTLLCWQAGGCVEVKGLASTLGVLMRGHAEHNIRQGGPHTLRQQGAMQRGMSATITQFGCTQERAKPCASSYDVGLCCTGLCSAAAGTANQAAVCSSAMNCGQHAHMLHQKGCHAIFFCCCYCCLTPPRRLQRPPALPRMRGGCPRSCWSASGQSPRTPRHLAQQSGRAAAAACQKPSAAIG